MRSFVILSAITAALACPQHDSLPHEDGLYKRAEGKKDWDYAASYNWGMINTNYTLCQAGTMQSPIGLMITQGLSLNHIPSFNYPASTSGNLYNWGYGPAFTLASTNSNEHEVDLSHNPSLTWDNQTVYLKGWHIHAPADHSVQFDRSKAELHLVHADKAGHEKAVVAIRIDPGNSASPFFSQFLSVPSHTSSAIPSFPRWDNTTTIPAKLDLRMMLSEVNNLGEFWTYKGSLTSPPCTEGIRWFVGRNVLFVSVEQMVAILRVSTYSARVEQEVWRHEINV